jgi:type VI secretion system secreted protein VgrG
MEGVSYLGCTFTSDALEKDKVRVISIDGVERLGQLYEFRVRFQHDPGPVTESVLDKLLLSPCTFTLGPNADEVINGIVREVETFEVPEGDAAIYEVVVVPTVWLLTVSKISRVYQKMSVADMATDILSRYSLSVGEHFDLRNLPSDKREFCIQYHESDWDFLQRWFEHEGFFYWFEHSDSGETLVVADSNQSTKPISGDASLPYQEFGGLNRGTDSVYHWRSVRKRIPAHVVLKDYNDQKPLLPLVGKADADRKGGFGVFFEYGDHFDTPAAGNVLAKKRAERLLTEQITRFGVTDCVRFHVGHSFTLTGNYDDAQNGQYLITAIKHHVGEIPARRSESKAVGYRATFEAIPLAVQFRPERRTEWPCIHGVMHGHIDSDSSGEFSTLDPQSRYKVRFLFDSSGKSGDSCSTWIRMAQPYAGSGYGSHHPLHKGTEVVVAFYDGDPDRPLIVGAVANAITPGPSVAANASQSVVKTASGIRFTMDDSVSKR